jgi:hypothetical protein
LSSGAGVSVTVLGIRHHGPGSARSVAAELEALDPDIVLIEGPSDASGLIPLAAGEEMRPPVALLVYAPDSPHVATFYPEAAFSPEWVAMRWALDLERPVRFIDLPAGIHFALWKAEAEGEAAEPEPAADAAGRPDRRSSMRRDPLQELAEAAGESDGERFWDRLVESRRTPGDVFVAILEAIGALREALPEHDALTLQREAWMRRGIREAIRQGFERIAVVCGAWHAPALDRLPTAAADDRTIKSLPRPLKTAAAWVPWTYERLASESGYGAGIYSPGWYEHLWTGAEPLAVSWMAKVARVFREEGLDASAAHLVDSARLAETLAAMRGRSVPSLAELNDAVRASIGFGSDLPMRLVRDRLVVGHVMGETPADAPLAPLAADLDAQTRRLRLKRESAQRLVDLDLRSDTDLARSHLLHRLAILEVPWGRIEQVRGRMGTFHEFWTLRWKPDFAVDLVASSRFGNTIEDAATTSAMAQARAAEGLPALTRLTESVLLADLRAAIDTVVARIGDVAAVGADVPALMEALAPLARVLRYGNVRGTDAAAVGEVVDGILARIAVGLAGAAASLDDDAAVRFAALVDGVHGAIALLDDAADRATWRAALQRLLERSDLHGLLAGRVTRLLLDEGTLSSAEGTRRMQLALSRGAEPAAGAAWVEGFLQDSGTILLHDPDLFAALDQWVVQIPGEAFDVVLPLLRRTLSTFGGAERRSIGERVREGPANGRRRGGDDGGADGALDEARSRLVLPILARILGVEAPR